MKLQGYILDRAAAQKRGRALFVQARPSWVISKGTGECQTAEQKLGMVYSGNFRKVGVSVVEEEMDLLLEESVWYDDQQQQVSQRNGDE